MQGQIKECWRELCERAVSEQDPEKFLVVVREINLLLEVKTERFKQSYPQLLPDAPQLPRCSLCDRPVLLETSKTDEHGKAVHEGCYALKTRLKQATTTPEG